MNVFEIQSLKKGSLSEKNGLTLRVFPNRNKKTFIFRLKIKGKEITQTLGHFPVLSLANARVLAKELYEKYRVKSSINAKKDFLVKEIIDEWLLKKEKEVLRIKDVKQKVNYFANVFDERYWSSLSVRELADFLKKLTKNNTELLESAKRVCIFIKQIEVYAFNSGYIDELKFQSLNKVLVPSKVKSRPSVHPNLLPEIIGHFKSLSYKSYKQNELFLVGLYTLLRPNEYCSMQWSWIDFDKNIITIPSFSMKMKKEHVVPISTQLKELLSSMYNIRCSKYVFSGFKDINKSISTNTLNKFMRENGFKDILCPHGFRSLGRTFFTEKGIPFEVAERCLAHQVGSDTERAYNRAELFNERVKAMQLWSDYVYDSFHKNFKGQGVYFNVL